MSWPVMRTRVAGFADAAFEHIAHAEFAPDLPDVWRLALVGEARIARDHEQRRGTRQRRDDVLDDAVGEILLLGIAAHVLERQHGDGRLVGQGERRIASERRSGQRCATAVCQSAASHFTPNARTGRSMFFSERLPKVIERRLQPAGDRVMDVARDHDAARRRFGLQPRRDVHAIAVEVVAIDDQVAEMQADAEHDGGVLGLIRDWPRP